MENGKKSPKQNKLTPLSEGELLQLQLPPQEIWYLMVGEISHGPYSQEGLQNFLATHPNFDHTTLASNGRDEGWKPLLEYPCFDQGAPLYRPNDTLLLLINGRPSGPYTLEHIRQQVDKREILLNTLASEDQGKSWSKLYRHPAFDHSRPVLKGEDIPFFRQGKQLQQRREGQLKWINLSGHRQRSLGGVLADQSCQSEGERKGRRMALVCLVVLGLGICSLAFWQNNKRARFRAHHDSKPLVPKIPLPTPDKDQVKPRVATPAKTAPAKRSPGKLPEIPEELLPTPLRPKHLDLEHSELSEKDSDEFQEADDIQEDIAEEDIIEEEKEAQELAQEDLEFEQENEEREEEDLDRNPASDEDLPENPDDLEQYPEEGPGLQAIEGEKFELEEE